MTTTVDLSKLGGRLSSKTILLVVGVIVLLTLGVLVGGLVVMRLGGAAPTNASAAQLAASTATPLPSPTPTPLPTPTPVAIAPPSAASEPPPTAVPTTTNVLWTSNEVGVYLRHEPGGVIIQVIPNGEEVILTGGVATYGDIGWVSANYQGIDGWIATKFVYEIESGYQRLENDTWMFKALEGGLDTYLWAGTPYHILQTQEREEDGRPLTWLAIRLPNGRVGWIKQW